MNNMFYMTFTPVYYCCPPQLYLQSFLCPPQTSFQNTIQPIQQIITQKIVECDASPQGLEKAEKQIPKEDCHTKSEENIHDQSNSSADESFQVQGWSQDKEKNYMVNQLKCSTNIQKNYAKAVILYSQHQREEIIKCLGEKKAIKFLALMKRISDKIRNISHISKYTKDCEFIRLFRILIHKFIKKESVCYIYNSKIQQKSSHLKGRATINKTIYKI